jgi:hypothetical protein
LARLQPRVPRVVKADDELLERLHELCGEDAVQIEKQTQAT